MHSFLILALSMPNFAKVHYQNMSPPSPVCTERVRREANGGSTEMTNRPTLFYAAKVAIITSVYTELLIFLSFEWDSLLFTMKNLKIIFKNYKNILKINLLHTWEYYNL
jgi:hypothetical protein